MQFCATSIGGIKVVLQALITADQLPATSSAIAHCASFYRWLREWVRQVSDNRAGPSPSLSVPVNWAATWQCHYRRAATSKSNTWASEWLLTLLTSVLILPLFLPSSLLRRGVIVLGRLLPSRCIAKYWHKAAGLDSSGRHLGRNTTRVNVVGLGILC